MQKTDFIKVLSTLHKHGVEFMVTGGISAVLHGAPVTTLDLDIIHLRSEENVDRLLAALKELNAYYRVRKDIRIEPEKSALMGKGHHLLLTDAGPLDVLCVVGKANQTRGYEDLLDESEEFEVEDFHFRSQSLESLIALKREIGREKDFAVLPVLESTLKEKKK